MEELLIKTGEFSLSRLDFIIRLLVAGGIGFLIGLEREHSAMASKENSFAGIRTFIIIVLAGFVGGLMYYLISPWIYGAIVVAVITLIGISYKSSAEAGDIGGTTEFTALISFFLGSLTLMGYIQISLFLAVLILLVLSAKIRLHRIVGKISQDEMYAIVRFVVGSIIILPFLPDSPMGPYRVINPREIGWVVILTSGIGFLGYLLMKFIGRKKGIILSGMIGGMVSSTMSTWVFSKKSREEPAYSAHFAAAILSASAIMMLRVLVWTQVFHPQLANGLYLPVGLMLMANLSAAYYFYKKKTPAGPAESSLPHKNPLEIQAALVFGLIYLLITLLVSYAQDKAGNGGILISAGIAGLTDIDAITISVAKLSKSTLPLLSAQNAVLMATISNTLLKTGIAFWAGSKSLKNYALSGFGFILITAIAGLFLLNML